MKSIKIQLVYNGVIVTISALQMKDLILMAGGTGCLGRDDMIVDIETLN